MNITVRIAYAGNGPVNKVVARISMLSQQHNKEIEAWRAKRDAMLVSEQYPWFQWLWLQG